MMKGTATTTTILAAATLVAGIFWAVAVEDVVAGLRYVAANRWGVVTLIDLLVGLVFVGTWIALLEGWRWTTVLWLIGLVGLGNLTTAIYLLRRLLVSRDLREALLPRSAAGGAE